MGNWGKLSYAQKQCVSATGMLTQKTGMFSPNARIGLAVSGGVDSFTLLRTMLIRQAIMPFPVELMVLHVNPGFEPASHRVLADWCAGHGVAAHLELTDYGPRAHTEENRKNSPCFYCSWLRRKRLFELCDEYDLSHLAFGHNADDLVVTYFMNMFQNGRAETIHPAESFFQGRLQVVRPMLFVEKSTMRAAARQWGLPIWENVCPSNGVTKRSEVHGWLQERFGKDKRIRNNVLGAVKRTVADLT